LKDGPQLRNLSVVGGIEKSRMGKKTERETKSIYF